MPIEFTVPNLGENVTSGDVVNVLVKEGDVIVGNQAVIELETDKAVVEIPCPYAGRIAKLLVKKGDTVKVGQPVLIVESEPAPSATPTPVSKAAEVTPSRTDVTQQVPVSAAAPLATTPVSAETEATVSITGKETSLSQTVDRLLPAGPATRRLARELGVNLAEVRGTGRHGRITMEDVTKAAQAAPVAREITVPHSVVPPGESDHDSWGPVRREKLTKIRKTIAAQMTRSWTTIPRVTNFDEADVTDLENLRKSVPPDFIGEGLKLTMMPFVMRAVSLALRHHPLLNASFDEENEQIIYKQYVNLGVAVDTPRGLVVPVVRNADRLSIPQLARKLSEVAKKARNVEFTVDELRGGTFTISNLGAVGGIYSTPIINYPEVAILLLGRSHWVPVVREGVIVPRYLMPLSLSYDHRLVDGAAAARFLNEVIDWLQYPGKLLLVS
ncbi:MAG: 2-oxo acid dehydrogenase subunit E2 [Thermogutta sp.]